MVFRTTSLSIDVADVPYTPFPVNCQNNGIPFNGYFPGLTVTSRLSAAEGPSILGNAFTRKQGGRRAGGSQVLHDTPSVPDRKTFWRVVKKKRVRARQRCLKDLFRTGARWRDFKKG